MIYAILGAIVVGLSLGIFGSGGSILTVPVLIYLLHHQDKAAIAESLAIVGAIALISAIPYAKAKFVDWRTAFIFGLPGMAGTYLGAWVAAFAPWSGSFLATVPVAFFWARLESFAPSKGGATWPRSRGPAPTRPLDSKESSDKILIGIQSPTRPLEAWAATGSSAITVPRSALLG